MEQCPTEKFLWHIHECDSSNFQLYKSKLICDIKVKKDSIKSCSDIEMLMSAQRCAKWYLTSQSCKF